MGEDTKIEELEDTISGPDKILAFLRRTLEAIFADDKFNKSEHEWTREINDKNWDERITYSNSNIHVKDGTHSWWVWVEGGSIHLQEWTASFTRSDKIEILLAEPDCFEQFQEWVKSIK